MNTESEMPDLTAEKQAAKAIAHTLRNIAERPAVAYYLGHGTQTYSLLTEAHATLRGITIQEARNNWPPAEQPKFEGDSMNQCPFCGSHYLEVKDPDDDAYVQCGDCKASGPVVDSFYCDDEATEAAARRKWNERQMPR